MRGEIKYQKNISQKISMESLGRRDFVVSLLVALFAMVYLALSLINVYQGGFRIFDVLGIAGVSLLLLCATLNPRMFFVSFKKVLRPDIPIILLSRKSHTFIGFVGSKLF
jgi:hypothetical protein